MYLIQGLVKIKADFIINCQNNDTVDVFNFFPHNCPASQCIWYSNLNVSMGKSDWSTKPSFHFSLMTRLKMHGATLPHLHGIVHKHRNN